MLRRRHGLSDEERRLVMRAAELMALLHHEVLTLASFYAKRVSLAGRPLPGGVQAAAWERLRAVAAGWRDAEQIGMPVDAELHPQELIDLAAAVEESLLLALLVPGTEEAPLINPEELWDRLEAVRRAGLWGEEAAGEVDMWRG